MALGAPVSAVARLVVARAALFVGIGVLVGGLVSLWASKFVTTLIYGLQPRDLATLVASAAVLTVVAACATWVPTRSAMSTEPASILRDM